MSLRALDCGITWDSGSMVMSSILTNERKQSWRWTLRLPAPAGVTDQLLYAPIRQVPGQNKIKTVTLTGQGLG